MLINKIKIKVLILISSNNIWLRKIQMEIGLEIKIIIKILNLKFPMLKDTFF